MSDDKLPVEVGETLAGKYVVERILGQGGMGVVVAARHVSLDERVAIKFLLREALDVPGFADRFANEARACARLKSEHVARVRDVDQLPDGTPFMVMEYLEGKDLAAILADRRRLPVSEACGYILQACEALAEAHAKGIVHRDLKPGNLFIARGPDGLELVKILDFGISKTEAPAGSLALTRPSTVLGSPLYMPPEQMTAPRDVDARADLWAIGILLYEMVTGGMPFDGDTLTAVVANIVQQKPKPMEDHGVYVPSEFERLVMRCLEKNPRDRMATVGELASGLLAFAPRSSDVSLDRITRIEATNPAIRLPVARYATEPQTEASARAGRRLELVQQSIAPPPPPSPETAEEPLPAPPPVPSTLASPVPAPPPSAAPSGAPASGPVSSRRNPTAVTAAATLAGTDLGPPGPRRPRRALLRVGLTVLALGIGIVGARMFASHAARTQAAVSPPSVASAAPPAVEPSPVASEAHVATAPGEGADATSAAPTSSASGEPASSAAPARTDPRRKPRVWVPHAPTFRLN
jgi:serine/threonine-protein kinase